MPLLRTQYPATELVFIDDGQPPGQVNGHGIVAWSDFVERQADEKAVSIAIAASKIRQTLADKCTAANIPLIEARAASVVHLTASASTIASCSIWALPASSYAQAH